MWIVAVLMTLFLGGAQVPEEIRTLRPSVVADELVVSWMLDGNTFYSLHSRPAGGSMELQARTVPSSEPLWTRLFDADGTVPQLRMAGPYLALIYGSQTVLLDASTGKARWRDDDYSAAMAAGDEVLLWTPEGRAGLLDPVTAKIRWRQEVAAAPIGVTTTEQHVQVLYDDGTAVAYGRAGGEVVNTVAELPVREQDTDAYGGVIDDGLPTLVAAGDLAIVFGPGQIAALRLPTLERLWTAPVPRPVGVSRCGNRVCVLHAGGMTALDQSTGAPLWSGTDWTTWNGTLAGGPGGRIARVDPDTGRILADRGRGQLAGTMVIRAGSDRTAVFDQFSGALRAIVPYALLRCDGTGDQIACQGPGGSVMVWRIPKT
ncbi:hypothetical protein SAMN04489716_5194 [Actinoplanes derwentensis]|uniref:Pyrrolo-quinoline quinone repeat domain-containing protein n=2 Tax=Actinoplanes derwentensis TaxID=113562 RepID=A0A1H2C323_9ACTN|nr:hypothetical protein SAMN04489716_5194 [Actinoplanes derwentensis]